MLNEKIKKMIIVSGEKEMIYAELLSSLISMKDDDEEKQIVFGIPDGSVESVVWDEKVYNNNKIQLGSNTKIVFIGKTKSSENIIPSIKFNHLKKYGINIGWISNKAVIYINSDVLINNKELYNEFFEMYKNITEKFDNNIADSEAIKKAKHTDGIDVAFGKSMNAVGSFFNGLFNKNTENNINTVEGTDFFDFGAKIEAGNLIPEQMYRYAIFYYYINNLSKFMEIE